jgi:hypothetical protein
VPSSFQAVRALSFPQLETHPHRRRIEELPKHIPRAVLAALESILTLSTREAIDAWHTAMEELAGKYPEVSGAQIGFHSRI